MTMLAPRITQEWQVTCQRCYAQIHGTGYRTEGTRVTDGTYCPCGWWLCKRCVTKHQSRCAEYKLYPEWEPDI